MPFYRVDFESDVFVLRATVNHVKAANSGEAEEIALAVFREPADWAPVGVYREDE